MLPNTVLLAPIRERPPSNRGILQQELCSPHIKAGVPEGNAFMLYHLYRIVSAAFVRLVLNELFKQPCKE